MSSDADKKTVKFKVSRASGKVLANQPVALNEEGEFVPQFEDDLRRLNHVVVSMSQTFCTRSLLLLCVPCGQPLSLYCGLRSVLRHRALPSLSVHANP